MEGSDNSAESHLPSSATNAKMPQSFGRKYIESGEGLAPSTSPISQAVVVGRQCYVSGQLAVDESGAYRAGSVQQEAAMAFSNLSRALRAAGFSVEDIVFLDVAMTDLTQLRYVNELFVTWFKAERRPARTVYQAAALPYGGKIKLYAIAVAD